VNSYFYVVFLEISKEFASSKSFAFRKLFKYMIILWDIIIFNKF